MTTVKFGLIAAMVFLSVGCADDLLGGPEIISMTVSPDSVASTATGMTDQFVTVKIVVSGFTDPIDVDGTRVFIENSGTEGVYSSATLSGDTITLTEIATSWFQELTPGSYPLGAEVVSNEGDNGEPTEQVSQLGLATITITP